MAIKKIPCGGWSYDDSEIVFEDGVIHPIGGGGSDAMIVTFTMDEEGNFTADKTYDELFEAMQNKTPIFGYAYASEQESTVALQNMSYEDGAFYFTAIAPPVWSEDEWPMSVVAIMVDEDGIIFGGGSIPFTKN